MSDEEEASSGGMASWSEVPPDALIHQAEEFFVKQDFKNALATANKILRHKSSKSLGPRMVASTILPLHSKIQLFDGETSSRIPTIRIHVEAVTLGDQAVAVALQSWWSIQSNLGEGGKPSRLASRNAAPVLAYITDVPISLQLLDVICFILCEQKKFHYVVILALDGMAARTYCLDNSIAIEPFQRTLESILVRSLTEAMPGLHLSSMQCCEILDTFLIGGVPSRELLERLDDMGHAAPTLPLKTKSIRLDTLVQEISNRISHQSLNEMKDVWVFARDRLQSIALEKSPSNVEQNETNQAEKDMNASPRRKNPVTVKLFWSSLAYIARLKSHASLPEMRRWVALSIALLLLAWRRRTPISKLFMRLILSPLQELVDALKTQEPPNSGEVRASR